MVNSFRFVAIDNDGCMHYIETMNLSNSDITGDIILFDCKK